MEKTKRNTGPSADELMAQIEAAGGSLVVRIGAGGVARHTYRALLRRGVKSERLGSDSERVVDFRLTLKSKV